MQQKKYSWEQKKMSLKFKKKKSTLGWKEGISIVLIHSGYYNNNNNSKT